MVMGRYVPAAIQIPIGYLSMVIVHVGKVENGARLFRSVYSHQKTAQSKNLASHGFIGLY